MDLNTPLKNISGIGPGMSFRLGKLNINTVWDLITHYPFRYEDYSQVVKVSEIKEGERVTLKGEIWSIQNTYTRSRKVITKAIFNDGTIPLELTWFNQSWLTKQIQVGDHLQISGKVTKYKNKLSIIAPTWEKSLGVNSSHPRGDIASHQRIHTGRLVPIYPETEGLSSKWVRNKIHNLALHMECGKLKDPLPEKVRDGMLPLCQALQKIHFPNSWQEVEKARERLGFDELFFVQLATLKTRSQWSEKPPVKPLRVSENDLNHFIKALPYQLTAAQKKVVSEVAKDLKKDQPMNRLIQGEVGSGKTVVAAIIIYIVHLNGLKTLFMAPTEILAFQHFSTLSNLLEPFGIKVGIYTGSKKQVKDTDVIVGTHALLSDKLLTEDVGLVVVDEQQRFGVEQRSLLRSRAKVPHFLTTTATPIPRTVALTLYGDLDLSIIDELPVGRKKVKTYVVPGKKRQDAYGFIAKEIKARGQVYIITPLIEESETLASAKAATVEYERLKKEVFPNLKLGLLHGRLKSKEKEAVLNNFKDKRIDILVSTSVVEVGVDVTNATIMMIESAERFGLAQLHQLRGRVGRGEKQSYCLLFTGDQTQLSRLKNLEKIDDGLKLAELDLKIRGSGEIFGTRQSGRFEFKIASLSDLALIEKTRAAAQKILAEDPSLDKYPTLKAKLQSITQEVMPD